MAGGGDRARGLRGVCLGPALPRGRPGRCTPRARTPRPPGWRASGPRSVVFAVFVVMGGLAGLAALLNAVRFADVDPNAGIGLELQVIAAVVVGGVAVSGGRGTLAGSLIGVALLGSIGPALVFLGPNLPAGWVVRQAPVGKGDPGIDHPAGGCLGFALTRRDVT